MNFNMFYLTIEYRTEGFKNGAYWRLFLFNGLSNSYRWLYESRWWCCYAALFQLLHLYGLLIHLETFSKHICLDRCLGNLLTSGVQHFIFSFNFSFNYCVCFHKMCVCIRAWPIYIGWYWHIDISDISLSL